MFQLQIDALAAMDYFKAAFGLLTLTLLSIATYRVYFHPLSKYPGPSSWAISRVPFMYNLMKGRLPYRLHELHEQYGPVVRIATDELSFITDGACNDLYLKPVGKPQLQKDHYQFLPPQSGIGGILFEWDDHNHSRIRRNFAPGFSDKQMREQEPILTKYMNLLITRLHERCSEPVNLVEWFNFTAFDIISDLLFAESFDCLEKSSMNEWIKILFDYIASAAVLGQLQRFGPLVPILRNLIPKSILDAERAHDRYTVQKLNKRLATDVQRPDFVTPTLKDLNTPDGISDGELLETVRIIIVGGSESIATALCSATYYLCRNPNVFTKLKDEIRGAFASYGDISKDSVVKLEYLTAIINEVLRIMPTLPGNMRRITPASGCTVSGHHVPGNTIVAYDLYAAGQSSSNFHDPQSFSPERYLPSTPPEFANDSVKHYQPFGIGPRMCLGKKLAYVELRMILAKLIWSFDCELEVESEKWVEGMKVFALFEKPALMVKLTPVER